jgi:hypothetical protein
MQLFMMTVYRRTPAEQSARGRSVPPAAAAIVDRLMRNFMKGSCLGSEQGRWADCPPIGGGGGAKVGSGVAGHPD